MIPGMSNSDIYDVILTVIVVVLIVAVAILAERVRQFNIELLRLRSRTEGAKNSSVPVSRAPHRPPGVDAHARTTRRDTDDLPHTGRMSQGVKRVKSNARKTDDDRLLPSPGSPAAQEWGSQGSPSS
jgi:hypothetical protein